MKQNELYEQYIKSKWVDFIDFYEYKEKVKNEPIRKTITNEIGQQFTCLCEPRRTVKCNCNIYFDCKKCKNASWYDDDYCNNQNIEGTSLKGKRDCYYCLNYEV